MRPASDARRPRGAGRALVAAALLPLAAAVPAASCDRPLYLTFDTGHMGVADHVAEVLRRQDVRATFFLADERTVEDGTSLDGRWAPWWRARAAEGHAFGSHTWHHEVWLADLPPGPDGSARFRMRPTQGPAAGRAAVVDEAAYCASLRASAARFRAMTGQPMGRLFRAPGGRTSPALLAAAARCGFEHVGWSPAGFLGDELPSERWSNAALLERALREVRPGDVLLAHLGIWSRRDPWAPAVLEPLIAGLKARGHCFATLREHPRFGAAAKEGA